MTVLLDYSRSLFIGCYLGVNLSPGRSVPAWTSVSLPARLPIQSTLEIWNLRPRCQKKEDMIRSLKADEVQLEALLADNRNKQQAGNFALQHVLSNSMRWGVAATMSCVKSSVRPFSQRFLQRLVIGPLFPCQRQAQRVLLFTCTVTLPAPLPRRRKARGPTTFWTGKSPPTFWIAAIGTQSFCSQQVQWLWSDRGPPTGREEVLIFSWRLPADYIFWTLTDFPFHLSIWHSDSETTRDRHAKRIALTIQIIVCDKQLH